MGDNELDPIAMAFLRANQINTRLSSKYDASLASEGKQVAQQLLDHIKGEVEDYEDFVDKAERSEEFTLHESAQLKKEQKRLKGLYLRATGLLDTIRDSESRKK